MESTPKSLRLHIALFGRTNVGKSTFLNLIAGQDVAITSPLPGTTTDVVEKSMELLPIGPVVLIDTAGLEDTTLLGNERIKRSLKVFDRADAALILCASGTCDEAEKALLEEACKRRIPAIAVVTKTDIRPLEKDFEAQFSENTARDAKTMFRHIYENQLFYKTYFKLGYDEKHQSYIYDTTRAERDFKGKHIKYHIEFFKNGLNSIIKMWLNDGCKETPEEMAEILESEYRGR